MQGERGWRKLGKLKDGSDHAPIALSRQSLKGEQIRQWVHGHPSFNMTRAGSLPSQWRAFVWFELASSRMRISSSHDLFHVVAIAATSDAVFVMIRPLGPYGAAYNE